MFAEMGRLAPYAGSTALTWTAKDAEAFVKERMPVVFDRPTRFTLNSTRTQPATVETMRSAVLLRDEAGKGTPASKYLRPQIDGGPRRHKRFEKALIAVGAMARSEFAVPAAGYPLDGYGNLKGGGGLYTRILSAVGASRDPTQNATPASRRRARGKRAGYFVSHGDHLPRGIYERRGRSIRAVLIFVAQAPTYRARFPFQQLVQQRAAEVFPDRLADAFVHLVARARRR